MLHFLRCVFLIRKLELSIVHSHKLLRDLSERVLIKSSAEDLEVSNRSPPCFVDKEAEAEQQRRGPGPQLVGNRGISAWGL